MRFPKEMETGRLEAELNTDSGGWERLGLRLQRDALLEQLPQGLDCVAAHTTFCAPKPPPNPLYHLCCPAGIELSLLWASLRILMCPDCRLCLLASDLQGASTGLMQGSPHTLRILFWGHYRFSPPLIFPLVRCRLWIFWEQETQDVLTEWCIFSQLALSACRMLISENTVTQADTVFCYEWMIPYLNEWKSWSKGMQSCLRGNRETSDVS